MHGCRYANATPILQDSGMSQRRIGTMETGTSGSISYVVRHLEITGSSWALTGRLHGRGSLQAGLRHRQGLFFFFSLDEQAALFGGKRN